MTDSKWEFWDTEKVRTVILWKMERKILLTATFFGLTAIILGAFGAHALKAVLNENQLISIFRH